ncbi:hypothetical protein AUG86_02665 [Euryarchaeota archaeon 13_1_20CM_4_64_14]|nr:MAG: hypothetical protein AUG86_02665 [Euryarchaeota archaeon 13_1_20CM_4_64_14]
MTISSVCIAVALFPAESVKVSVTLYAPVRFHAYDTEHPVPKFPSAKSQEQRYPPDPPPPVATRYTVSFSPATKVDATNETVSGPPGGPRFVCTSTEPFCHVWFPPVSPMERLTTKWPAAFHAWDVVHPVDVFPSPKSHAHAYPPDPP